MAPQTTQSGYVFVPPENSILFVKVLNPIYSAIVLWYPTWWTANGITLFGIACTVLASLITLSGIAAGAVIPPKGGILDGIPRPIQVGNSRLIIPPAFADGETIPPLPDACWLVIAGVLNLVYCIADNTDGKQARRLKQSSPIGEYLDHGLDCVTSLLSTFCLVSCIGLPFSAAMVAQFAIIGSTTLSHAVHYFEHVFIFGNKYVSVDEAMLAFGFGPILVAWWPTLRTMSFPVPSLSVDFSSIGWTVVPWTALFMLPFVLGQLQMMYGLLRMRLSLLWDRSVVSQVVFLTSVVLAERFHKGGQRALTQVQLTEVHDIGSSLTVLATLGAASMGSQVSTIVAATLSGLTAVFSNFTVLLCLLSAFGASIIIHVHIAGRCTKDAYGGNAAGIALLLFIGVPLFLGHPTLGVLVTIAIHVWQVLYNIRAIRRRAAYAKYLASQ